MDKVVSYFEHEEVMIRMERGNRRLWVLCIILIIALLVTNGWWIYRESKYEDVVTTIEAEQQSEQGGTNYIVNGNYGETESTDNN